MKKLAILFVLVSAAFAKDAPVRNHALGDRPDGGDAALERHQFGARSVDGRSHSLDVADAASTCAGTMSVECSVELCAESMAPSSTCAQLHRTCTLTMLVRTFALGAHAGGSNSRIRSGEPIHTQTNPPPSRHG